MLGSQLNTAQREEATFRLKSLSLFAPFDNEVMDDLLGHVTLKSLKEDDVLFKQDEVAKHFFVVQTGQVKLLRSSNAGNEKIIEFVSAGQSFAEAVMFSGKHLYPGLIQKPFLLHACRLNLKRYRVCLQDLSKRK